MEHIFPPANPPVEATHNPSPILETTTFNSTWVELEFEPAFNFRDLIAELKVGFADCGVGNGRQRVVFFGNSNDIFQVRQRFKVAFESLKEWRRISRTHAA